MLLDPMLVWVWTTDSQQHNLAVSNQHQQVTALTFPVKKLRQSFDEPVPLTLEDCQLAEYFSDQLSQYLPDLSKTDELAVVLHAVAAVRFGQQVTLKSWHFAKQRRAASSPVALVESDYEQGVVLIIESNENVSTCLLLTDALTLDDNVTLPQFSVMRVMNDRLLYL